LSGKNPDEIKAGPAIDPEIAKAWVECLNNRYPNLYHWAEPLSEKDVKNG